MRKIKNILILAGGDGSRFWPLSQKSYFLFLGIPLLQHLIEYFGSCTEKITIIINSSDVQMINRFNSSLKFSLIEQQANYQGQAGAILSAKNKITGEVLILNAEDFFNFKVLIQFIDRVDQKDLDYLCLAKKVDNYFPGVYLNFSNNRLISIVEKPDPEKIPSNLVKLVADYFKDFNQLILALEKTETNRDDQYEQAINAIIDRSTKTNYVLYEDYWYPLKYPWHVLPLMKYFLNQLNKEIRVGKNVKIAKTAKIVGPCFIDDNSIIGDFTMLRDSHIGKNCLIGGYSEVTRSYLGDNVSLHRNYVGDSVLANNVLFGAQAATANFRFDSGNIKSAVNKSKIDTNLKKLGAIIGSGSKIGVNSTILPGVKIGKNTYIAPGYTIAEDVEDKKFIFKRKTVKNIHNGI